MQTQRKTRKRKYWRQFNRSTLVMLSAIVIISIGVILGVQLTVRNYIKEQDDGTILSGITVGGLDVSGMTKKEAHSAVEEMVSNYGKSTIQFQIEGGNSFDDSLTELGFSADNLDEAVEEAADFGHSDSLTERYRTLKSAEKGELSIDFPLDYAISDQKGQLLEEQADSFLNQPVNAAVKQEGDEIIVVDGVRGESLDTEKTIQKVNTFLNEDWDGKGGTIKATIKETDPAITADDLKDCTDVLGTYTTTFEEDDGTSRAMNITSGASYINGTLLQPGEEMSANDAMAPYTEERGYAEANSYEDGTVVQSMGGGICQVSTTLYNALLYAELEIVERYPHSMLVDYVEPSMDAAIAEDLLDLVFRNDLSDPIYIEALVHDATITFNIYGKETRSPGRSLEFFSESDYGDTPEEPRFVANNDEAIGYLVIANYAQPEINAQLWKVVYENGEEVSREAINYSTYQETQTTYSVGVSSDDPAATDLMTSAIASQDEETIRAAIAQVQSGEY